MTKVGHFLKEWRKHRGLTQAALAKKIGIDRTYYLRIEAGKKRYEQSILEKASAVLGCSPVDILRRDPAAPPTIYEIMEEISPFDYDEAIAALEAIKARRAPPTGR